MQELLPVPGVNGGEEAAEDGVERSSTLPDGLLHHSPHLVLQSLFRFVHDRRFHSVVHNQVPTAQAIRSRMGNHFP